ncbi:hypothetical protein BD847_3129 [Flavobacterium cutihirudinis]|uniref:DUF4304 domain-containing protein n=1 Tax=Flavobacterium cutihirudinis TaxID=1265740 RepID=A0A3D9FPU8_9FLAO|nr:hypothetical protein [Flavobacterium cutihirudinis]RED22499.1 hypothetical protein BD847_3129 [Flavobacterium cutihirudinis]
MAWQDLKFYKPIDKTELSNAKKSIENIIAEKLAPFGFKKLGRKLIRKSNDIIHIIHLDSRGSWSGSSNSMQTEFAIVSIYDTDILVENFEPISSSYIQHLKPELKNFYQITQEFNLFSEYLGQKIVEIILPYFDRYMSSKDVLEKNIQIGKTKNLNQLCILSNTKNLTEEIEQDLNTRKSMVLKKLKITEH